MLRSLPNYLTLSRIIVIPLVLLVYYFGEGAFAHQLSAGLFLVAGLTDILDGYLARAWGVQSNLGRFMDPVADKLLVGSLILVMVDVHAIHILPALAIICREILVSGLREFLADLHISVPVSKLAKIKTFVQMSALFWLLLGTKGSGIEYADLFANIISWLAAILTVVTGYAYLQASLRWLYVEPKSKPKQQE
jgi:cardiolipin synthase